MNFNFKTGGSPSKNSSIVNFNNLNTKFPINFYDTKF
jgi:hypothetical protein